MKYLVCTVLFCLLLSSNGFSNSLYKAYTDKSRQDLIQETQEMSEQIKDQFDQDSMERAQQKIDAYDYFSNLKKMILYGSKLSTYSEYETDLNFAKDNELFRGLPEKEEDSPEFTKRFVNEKYDKMMVNVRDEIETYQDLIYISLDSCELLSSNDLSGFVESTVFRRRMQAYFDSSRDFQLYQEKQDRLAKKWPEIESRINRQIMLWKESGNAPDDPIIDPMITKALSNETDV